MKWTKTKAYKDMNDYIDNLEITPPDWETSSSIIKVIGVGGGGCNAVS